MTSIVLTKANAKLKFLYRQSRHIIPAIRRLLCNELIQSHFDYGCSSWFPLLKKKLKIKLQKDQNKHIRFLPYLQDIVSIDPRMLESLAKLSNVL